MRRCCPAVPDAVDLHALDECICIGKGHVRDGVVEFVCKCPCMCMSAARYLTTDWKSVHVRLCRCVAPYNTQLKRKPV